LEKDGDNALAERIITPQAVTAPVTENSKAEESLIDLEEENIDAEAPQEEVGEDEPVDNGNLIESDTKPQEEDSLI